MTAAVATTTALTVAVPVLATAVPVLGVAVVWVKGTALRVVARVSGSLPGSRSI